MADTDPHEGPGAPPVIVVAAGWAWRLLVLALAGYVIVRILAILAVVVLAFLAALVLTAVLRPITQFLIRYMPGALAALLTLLLGAVVVAGVGYFIGLQAASSGQRVIDQLIASVRQLSQLLQGTSLFQGFDIEHLGQRIIGYIQQHRNELTSALITGAGYVTQFVTGLALSIFITFFLVWEGERIWGRLLAPLPSRAATRIDAAGRVAWQTVYGYIRGLLAIATFHGVVVGIVLALLGVPLVSALALLVFIGSFVPIVGALIAGGIAALVTLATKGLVAALILLGVLLLENQLEGNVLQPIVMGHYVRIHPLAIGVSLVVGALLAGIVGAIVAVPAAAVVYRAVPALFGQDEVGKPEQRPTTREEDD